jgi:uncharacterized membrane protein
MTEKSLQQPKNIGGSKYLITVKGKLAENWADLFNGVLIDFIDDVEDGSLTVLACQVQDQAELTGILNWIHQMNLVLLEVTMVRKEKIMSKNNHRTSSGSMKFTGLGMAIGLVFGWLVGTLIGNPIIFAGGGMVLGLAIGTSLYQRSKE